MSRFQEKIISLNLHGRIIRLTIRRHPKAKNIILRIEPRVGPIVTIPWNTPYEDGVELAKSKKTWLIRQVNSMPLWVYFIDGARIPFLGIERTIRHNPNLLRPVILTNTELQISGHTEHLSRRLKDWLKKEAKRMIIKRVEKKSSILGLPYKRITIRDTKSRWGSCSEDGSLSFCWRLIMFPEMVLDYVVAHEVAHLKEMNHSVEFWNAVKTLTHNSEFSKRWLRINGDRIFYYG